MNKFKTDYPCDLKLWLMYFSTIIFSNYEKNAFKKGERHFKLCRI